LTVISTIFVPATFLVDVYGMNFDNMPKLRKEWGYFVLWGIMLSIALGMLRFFRKHNFGTIEKLQCGDKPLREKKRRKLALPPLYIAIFQLFQLPEQLENALRLLVGLRQHCSSSLIEDIVLLELHHFFGHIYVANAGFSSRQIF